MKRSGLLFIVVAILVSCSGFAFGQGLYGGVRPGIQPFSMFGALPSGAMFPSVTVPEAVTRFTVFGPEFYVGYADCSAKLSSNRGRQLHDPRIFAFRDRGAWLGLNGLVPVNDRVNLIFKASYVVAVPFHDVRPGDNYIGYEAAYDGSAHWYAVKAEFTYDLGQVFKAVAGVQYDSYDSRRETSSANAAPKDTTTAVAGILANNDDYFTFSAIIPYLGLMGDFRSPRGSLTFGLLGFPAVVGDTKFNALAIDRLKGTSEFIEEAGRLRNTFYVEGYVEGSVRVMDSSLGFFLRGTKIDGSMAGSIFGFERTAYAVGMKLMLAFGNVFQTL